MYLGGPLQASSDARSAVLDVGYWQKQDIADMDGAMQVLSRYRLLDIFADVINIPKHPSVRVVAPMPFNPIRPDNFQRVRLVSFVYYFLTIYIVTGNGFDPKLAQDHSRFKICDGQAKAFGIVEHVEFDVDNVNARFEEPTQCNLPWQTRELSQN